MNFYQKILIFLVVFLLNPILFIPVAHASNAGDIAKSYVKALFERRYEDAYSLLENKKNEEKEYDKYDIWMAKYFSPSNLKVIKTKKSKKDGSTIVVLTFHYANANNAKTIERVSIKLDNINGNWKVKKALFSSQKRRRKRKRRRSRERQKTNYQPSPSRYAPVTIPQNYSSPSGGGLTSLFSGGGGLGALMSGPIMQMMSDPEVIELMSDPKFQSLSNDPSIMSAIMSGNIGALQNNPKIKSLMNDPRLHRLMKKYQNTSTGEGSVQQILNMMSK